MTTDPLRLTLGTLTAFPVPAPRTIGPRTAGRAMVLAPVAGIPLGVAVVTVLVLADLLTLPGAVGAACAIGALALATRGMHLDGLADSADGLAAGYDRDRALTIMRTGDVGPAGAATLVLTLLVQTGSLAAGVGDGDLRRFVCVPMVALLASRATLACCCVRGVPSARPEGLGATVAGTVSRRAVLVGPVVVAAASSLGATWAGLPWWTGPVVVLVCLAVGTATVLRAIRRLGGITGDVLGAAVELSFTAALVTLAAVTAHLG